MMAVAAILHFDRNDLAIFDRQITPILPAKFGVNLSFRLGEKFKIDFRSEGLKL